MLRLGCTQSFNCLLYITVTRTRRTTDRCPPPEAQTRSTIPARPTGTHTRPLTSQPSPSQAEITQPHTSHSASQTSTPPTSAPHPAPSSCSYPARSTCCGGCYRTPIHTRPQTQGRARPPRRPTSSCPRTCGPNLAHAPNAPLARGSPRCPLPCCTGIVISPCWLPTPRPSSLPTEASPYTLPEASISSGAACTRPQAHTYTSTRHAHAMRTREYT